jgi:hypothetical protein
VSVRLISRSDTKAHEGSLHSSWFAQTRREPVSDSKSVVSRLGDVEGDSSLRWPAQQGKNAQSAQHRKKPDASRGRW